MTPKKLSFKQRWFPSFDDAEAIEEATYTNKHPNSNYQGTGIKTLCGRWIRTLALGGALIWATLWGGYNLLGNNINFGEGVRTGMINKVSKKGLIWKTNEAQMALEGIVSDKGNVGANVWDFSLDNEARHGENIDELSRKLREYCESGTKVKIKYVQQFSTWPWRSETNYLAQSVEPVPNK